MKGDYDVENDTVRERLDELRDSLETVWGEEIEAFELTRTYTNDGELKELVFDIPTEDEYDPYTFLKIHNENGSFVAGDVLDELGEEMLRLKSESVYVETGSNTFFGDTLYLKEDDGYFRAVRHYRSQQTKVYEYWNEKGGDSGSNKEELKYWCLLMLIFILFSPLILIALLIDERREIPFFFAYICTPLCILILLLYDLVNPLHKGTTYKKELVSWQSQ